GARHHVEQVPRGPVEHGDEQLAAVAERLVEVAIGEAGPAAHVLDAGGLHAARAELLERRVEQALAARGDALLGADAPVRAAWLGHLTTHVVCFIYVTNAIVKFGRGVLPRAE